MLLCFKKLRSRFAELSSMLWYHNVANGKMVMGMVPCYSTEVILKGVEQKVSLSYDQCCITEWYR